MNAYVNKYVISRHVMEEQLKRKLTGVTERSEAEKDGSGDQTGEKDGNSLLNDKTQRIFNEDSSTVSEADVFFGVFLPEGLDVPVEDGKSGNFKKFLLAH